MAVHLCAGQCSFLCWLMSTFRRDPPVRKRLAFYRLKLDSTTRFLLGLLVLGVVIKYAGPPTMESISHYRGSRLLDQARESMSAKQWKQAGESLGAAMPLMPDDPKMLRVLVQFLEATEFNPMLLRDALLRLREQGQSQASDAVLLPRALLSARDLRGARTAFDSLLPAQKESEAGQKLAEDLLKAEGRRETTDDLLTDEVRNAIQDCEKNFPELKEAGFKRLWLLSQKDDESALQAINYLSSFEALTPQEAELLVARINNHPNQNLSSRLGAYSGLMRVAPSQKDAVLKKLVIEFRNAPLVDLKTFIQWLALEGQPDLIRSLVTIERLYEDGVVFSAYAQSLAEKRRWQELIDLIESADHELPVSAPRSAIWQAEAWRHLEPDQQKASSHLQRCIDMATRSGNFGALQVAATIAEKHGLWEIAIRSYTALAEKNPMLAVPLLEKGMEAANQSGSTAGIHKMTAKLAEIQPKNSAYTARLCYLRLLMGHEIETITLPDPTTLKPEIHALLCAMSSYRVRDLHSMKNHLSAISDTSDFAAGELAVYAGMLAAAGETKSAFEIAERINQKLLLSEEQVFLKAAL